MRSNCKLTEKLRSCQDRCVYSLRVHATVLFFTSLQYYHGILLAKPPLWVSPAAQFLSFDSANLKPWIGIVRARKLYCTLTDKFRLLFGRNNSLVPVYVYSNVGSFVNSFGPGNIFGCLISEIDSAVFIVMSET